MWNNIKDLQKAIEPVKAVKAGETGTKLCCLYLPEAVKAGETGKSWLQLLQLLAF
jgi:hypothetical protein